MSEVKKHGGIKDVAQGRSDIFRIDPRELKVRPGWNAREVDFNPNDEEDLALARSIAENGVREALTAIWEDGAIYVTNGHRRRAATLYALDALGAEIKTVPVQTEPRYSSEADHVLSQIVRNSGKPLSPFEKGKVFKRLLDLGWGEGEIAAKAGLSEARIRQLLELHAAPEAVKAFVRSGEVSASLAMDRLKVNEGDGEKAAAELQGAVAAARAEGKARAMPKHVEGTPRANLKAALKDAFDAADIDDSDGARIHISMPADHFDRVRELLRL